MEFELIGHTSARAGRRMEKESAGRIRGATRSPRHDPAPELPLRAPDGSPHSLADFRGQNVVLHVLDKNKSNAARHARSLQDHLQDFERLNATVLGIAPAGLRAQRRFAKKNHIDFLLLSDKERALLGPLGADGNATIIIDQDGRIDKMYAGGTHAEKETDRVLRHLRALRQEEIWEAGAPPPQ